MKSFKKWVALFLVFAFALSVCLASLNAQKAYSSATSSGTKKIVFWHIQTNEDAKKVIQRSVDRFMAANRGVKVEVVPLQNDAFKTKLKIAMGANQAPDVFPTWGGGQFYEYIKSGKVKDITAYMNEKNYKNRFLDGAISMVTFDNKIWAVPVENVAIAIILYNKEIFKKYNLKVPSTYDELLNIVKTLKAKGIAPFALANKTKWPGSMFYMYLVDRLGGPSVFERAANRKGGSFEDPVFIKAGEMLQELVRLGAFAKGYNGLDYDTGQSRMLLYAGKAAMELMGSWEISVIKSENKKFYDNNLDFFPFPAIKGGKGDPNNVVGTLGDNFYAISSRCKYPKEAFKMIQYLIDDQAVKERIQLGRIPPVKGVKLNDSKLQKLSSIISKAKHVQLWYDQYLPPQLAEVHKDTCQALFGLTMTPKAAVQKMEKTAKAVFGK
ncbi:extracellular solute-binding protein [Caldicellulosiruptor naganoensis]|uniref:Extracellular solute-binding protein n=1 Tax=Caldicellulosiruptor naganoensis TaxID=29324 RepID=A0ABY7BGM2_9FIRM|nr:extracellular solute-binding protein [Caldicellulosiruptor naganoensis]WAM31975.1 extracellular solute-binding protein [Caldicellulosiruptor naganoensis]